MRERPNVLMIVVDQMRRDALGLNRPGFVHTPHLDQLAREGINFTRAYSACPTCIAARATLSTRTTVSPGTTPVRSGGIRSRCPASSRRPATTPSASERCTWNRPGR